MSMYYIRSNFLLHQKRKTKKPTKTKNQKNKNPKKTNLLTGIQFSSKVLVFLFFWFFGFLVFWFFVFLVFWFFGFLVFWYFGFLVF